MFASATWAALTVVAAFPALRVAVLVDDPGPGSPGQVKLEQGLQDAGYELVLRDVADQIRKVVTPADLLASKMPEGLSVFEADAIVAGSVVYGEPTAIEGTESVPVAVTVRVVDLATARLGATVRTEDVGIGVPGPNRAGRGAGKAVDKLLKDERFKGALAGIGQSAGSVTLVVKGLPHRQALLDVRRAIERELAGVPVKELYFTKGLGKLLVGGADTKVMHGPEIGDILTEKRAVGLVVDEVANTRIVASYDPARAVSIQALVLEPKLPKKHPGSAVELGRFVATHFASFGFAKASFQPGSLSRADAMKQAQKVGADVIVESEVLGGGASEALVIRVLDVKTGQPIFRDQRVIERGDNFKTAEAVLAGIKTALPEKLRPEGVDVGATVAEPTAKR